MYLITRCGDMAICVSWVYVEPHFGGRGRRGSAMAPFERAMVVYYRLSIVTVAISVTIRPQFAIEFFRDGGLFTMINITMIFGGTVAQLTEMCRPVGLLPS